MDATKLLEQQHREVDGLFEKLSASDTKKDAALKALVQELARKLLTHMIIEQTIFYPAVADVDQDFVHEGYEEHHVARGQIARLAGTSPDEDTFDARVTTLKELIKHHVKEEEQEFFPKIRKKMSAERLNELGVAMKTEFDRQVERLPRTLFARAEAVDVLADT